MTWPGFERVSLIGVKSRDSALSSCALTKSREKAISAREISAFSRLAWDGLEIRTLTWKSRKAFNVDVNCHTIKEKQEKLFSATLSKTVNMTNKQNPEEISALDSSKHGDSPNSLGKPDSIIEALSLMTKQLVSSITTLNSSMGH